MKYSHKIVPSPVGPLKLVASEASLLAVLWEKDSPGRVSLPASQPAARHPILNEAARQLRDYFAGRRERFELPLAFQGTPFQCEVWAALSRIPFGETRSYSDLAREIGSPRAVRAVGSANGRNPLSIVIPCQRVIAKGGGLAGFAGGLAKKKKLLSLEGRGA